LSSREAIEQVSKESSSFIQTKVCVFVYVYVCAQIRTPKNHVIVCVKILYVSTYNLFRFFFRQENICYVCKFDDMCV